MIKNINKIDYELKNLFDSVIITEKAERGSYYFQITASSKIEENKTAEVKLNILKSDLNSDNVRWSYYTNPINETSDLIERVSNIESISKDIFDILSKKKMDKEYFESLYNEVNEKACVSLKISYGMELNPLEKVLKSFKIENLVSEDTKYHLDGSTPERTLIYLKELNSDEKINLTSKLEEIGAKYVSFVDDKIRIKI